MSSHAVKYRCTHKELSGDNSETTFIIEILEDGFSGSVTEVKGMGDVFRLNYDKIDARNPTENPVQKGRLEFYLAVEDSGDLAILEEFLAADEDQYQMRLKQDGSIRWTGFILTDLLEYSEGDYPFSGKIVAKDLTRLSGIDFPLTDDRVTLITTLADFLDDVGLGLDIYTYTSWITEDTTDTDDFLNQIYNERKAFREFGRTGDEDPQQITIAECLERFLRNYGLILRQENNAWRVYQITALSDPTSVSEFVYDSTGTKTATNTKDLTVSIDRVNRYLLPPSTNEINPGIKRAKATFQHRTKVSNIQFNDRIELDPIDNPSESFSQFFVSDGDQEIDLEAVIEATYTGQTVTDAVCVIQIQIGGHYWDGSSLVPSPTTFEEPLTALLDAGKHRANLMVNIDSIPADADGTFQVSFSNVTSPTDGDADSTTISNVFVDIINPIASENTEYIDYQLTQSDGYSTNFEIQDTWFGDGPTGYSPAALRYDTGDNQFTSDVWQFRGTTTGYRNFHENLLKEVINPQRGPRRNIQAQLWGDYNSTQIVSHDSKHFFFLGGDLTGRNYWNAQILELNIEDGSDDFDDINKYVDESVEGTGTSSSSTGGTGGGLSESVADQKYAKQASNASDFDSISDVRSNLGLEIGTDVQAWSSVLDDLSNNLTATATELNRLDGSLSQVQDNLGLKDGSADLRFNTLQVDGALTLEGNVAFNADGALFSYNTDGTGRGLWGATASGTQMWQARLDSSNNLNFDRRDAGAGELQSDGNTIWHAGNDGPGSGLDADLWDGNQFADYLNQPVRDTDAVDFVTVNTGQGNNELYPMDQAVRTTDGVQFNMVTVDATSGIPFEIREAGTFRAALNYGYSFNGLSLETGNSADTRTERMRIAGEQDATQIALGTTSYEGFGLNVDLASQFKKQTEFQDRVIFEDAYSASFNAHVSINNTMQGENALLTLGSIDSGGTSRTGGVGFNPDLNTVFLRNGPDSRFEMFANGDLVSDGSLDFQDSDGSLGHNIDNLNELNVRDISTNRGSDPIEILDGINVAEASTFNNRLTAANDAFVMHENGWSYYDIAGQSFVFNADSSTRGFLSIARGSVGETGPTNRLWNLEIKASDDIVFNPDTGGGVDFPSEISNNNQSFTTGFLGNGWKHYEDSSEWYLETDVGFFRSALFANEFTINQILATQGSRIASPGRGKVETIVDGTTGSEIIEFSDPEGNNYPSMAVDDTVFCLQVRNDLDVGTTNVLEDDGGVIVKRFVRRVSAVNGTEVTLDSFAAAPNDAGTISEGDVFVVIGNISDTSRQNLLYETVIEPHAPYTVLKTDITGWNAYKSADNIMMKYGNLNQSYGYTSDTYGLAVGPPSGDHATFDATDGVRFIDGSGLVGAQFNSSILTLGTGDNFVEFDVSAGSGNIELDTFTLDADTIRIISAGNGLVRVGDPTGSDQIGLTGSNGADSIGFFAGESFSNRSSAPIWIKRGGDFHFGGSGSDFIESSGGTLTADFGDISFSSTTFNLDSSFLHITDQNEGVVSVDGTNNGAGLSGDTSNGSDSIAIWAGDVWADRGLAPFRVTRGGSVHAENGYFEGEIVVTGGNASTQSYADTQASNAQSAAESYTDGKVFHYAQNAFLETDDASVYTPKPSFVIMEVTNTGWDGSGGSSFGVVEIRWSGSQRASMVYTDSNNRSFEREVHPATYPTWSDWRETEDTAGAQSKADSARDIARDNIAARLGYTDYSALSSDTLPDTLITGSTIRTTLIDAHGVLANVGTFTDSLFIGSQQEHVLDGVNNSVSFSNGVLAANADGTVDFAAFSADSNLLSMSNNGIDIEMGNGPFGSGVRGFAVSDGTSNSRIYLAEVAGEFVFSVRESGNDIAELGSRDNFIAGWDLTASQFQSTNLSGGGDGSFTTDGILINSAGFISAPNFYIDSAGAASLGDLTVSGVFTVAGSNVSIGQDVYNSASLGLQDGMLTAAGLFSDQGWDIDARAGTGGQIEFHDTNQSDDLTSNSNLVGELQVNFDDANDISTLLMRAQTVGAGWDSHITLNATQLNVNAGSIFNGNVQFDDTIEINFDGGSLVTGYLSFGVDEGGRFRLPVYNDTTRPSSPNPGDVIFNTDAGNIQFADNASNWQGV